MPIRFTKELFKAFENDYAQDWYLETARKLLELYPDYMNAFGADLKKTQNFCERVHINAKSAEIFNQRDVFKLAVLSLSLGLNFRDDPRFKKALSNSLERTHIPEGRRVILLSEFAHKWVQADWQKNNLAGLGEKVSSYIKGKSSVLTDATERREGTLTLFLPEFSGEFEICSDFFRLTEQHCASYGLHHGVQRFAYFGCSVSYGVKWFDDPLLENLKKVFSTSKTSNNLCEGIRDFYKGFA
jgi:hypothetical protein